MQDNDPFVTHQIKSFSHAFKGIIYSFKVGFHFKVQVLVLALVVILGFIYTISTFEWLTIVLISSAVIAAETFNTAIEETCNLLHPEIHPHARLAKHCAAGAVLIFSIAALIVAALIFLPKVLS